MFSKRDLQMSYKKCLKNETIYRYTLTSLNLKNSKNLNICNFFFFLIRKFYFIFLFEHFKKI